MPSQEDVLYATDKISLKAVCSLSPTTMPTTDLRWSRASLAHAGAYVGFSSGSSAGVESEAADSVVAAELLGLEGNELDGPVGELTGNNVDGAKG